MTTNVIGYEVRFAFECKNYERPIDVPKVGEFIDKLHDVGIAPQNSILVSVSGFTNGAIDRARQVGMQTLVLSGLATDRLTSAVIEALQSVIYLLPVVTEWMIINDSPQVDAEEMWLWFDEKGEVQVMTPDLLWHRWLDGTPPSIIGSHQVTATAPGWAQRVGGKASMPSVLRFTVDVVGYVITFAGHGTDHRLINAVDQKLTKRRVTVEFDGAPTTDVPLQMFSSEEELTNFIQTRTERIQIINRVRLPRLQWYGLYWPLSERATRELEELTRTLKAGETVTAQQIFDIERGSLDNVWEPPAVIPKKPRRE